MVVLLNGVSSWLCNVCGHVWPRRGSYAYGSPMQCPLCRARTWNRPSPDDPGAELCGA